MWEAYLGHTVFLAIIDLCLFFYFVCLIFATMVAVQEKKYCNISLPSYPSQYVGLSYQPKYQTVNQHVV